MATPALILLHAPSVYDFRTTTILRGPVSDLVPSSSIFEMYPVGFTSIAAHLEANGYMARIVNLAAKMLADADLNVDRLIADLPTPLVFGIDLHWLPHAHGALAIAEIVKRHHPNTPILFGGFSSTYFHEELLRTYPQVDLVMRGDSTEAAVLALIEALAEQRPLTDIPNLTWRDASGVIHVNQMTNSPPDLALVDLNYRRAFFAAVRDQDISSYLPFVGWLRYPIMPAISCRGCLMNCVGCGGSAFAFRHLHHRDRPAFRPPEKLADDMRKIAELSNGPIFVIGDLRQGGPDYTQRFFKAVRGLRIPVIIELFYPATREYLHQVSEAFPSFALEVSPESHDPVVRRAYGKPYTNEEIEHTIEAALAEGARRIDVFFMIGLPEQTYDSVMGTADYARHLLERFGAERRLRPFIGPMAPFVDPGSLAFEQPEARGYTIFHRTLEEHRRALLEPSWQFTLNYETRWMTRREIVLSTYDSGMRFCDLKAEYGLITPETHRRVSGALAEGRRLAVEIERLREAGDTAAIAALHTAISELNAIRVLEANDELQLPKGQVAFKWLRMIPMFWRVWLNARLNSGANFRAQVNETGG